MKILTPQDMQASVAQRTWQARRRLKELERRLSGGKRGSGVPQHADVRVQSSFVQNGAIGIPGLFVDVRILDRSHAFAMQHVQDVFDALAALFGRGRRYQRGHQILRRFLQDATGIAVRIFVDGAGAGIKRLRVDVSQAKRIVIGDAVVAGGVFEPHGIVWCYCIQVRGSNVATLIELALIPATTLHPLTRLDEGHRGLHSCGYLLPRS